MNISNKISFVVDDITKLRCDAIVNAANRSLLGGGGVDGAIHRAAGPELLEECRALNGCNTGESKITKGYRLIANYVIHTVGPKYYGDPSCANLLAGCYKNSLDLAQKYGVHSIAFPAISTGAYHYPPRDAAEVALKSISEWISENPNYDIKIILCCYDEKAYAIYQEVVSI